MSKQNLPRYSKIVRLHTGLIILLATLILMLLSVVVWQGFRAFAQADTFQAAWHHIHDVKEELLLLQGDDAEFDSTRLQQQLLALERVGREHPGLGLQVCTASVLALQDAGSEEVQAEILRFQSMEDEFQQKFWDTHAEYFRLIVAALVMQAVLLIGSTLTFFRFRRYILRFQTTMRRGIARLNDVIRFSDNPAPLPEARQQEEAELLEATESLVRQLEGDRALSELGPGQSLEQLVMILHPVVARSIPCDRLALAFIDPLGNVTAESAYTVMEQVFLEPGFTVDINRTTLPAVMNSGQPRIINDLYQHYRTVHQSLPTEWILKEGLQSSITLPLFIQDECIGFMFVSSRHRDAYREEHAGFARHIANNLKEQLYYSYLLQQVIAKTAEGFVTLAQKKDNETSEHIVRMARYSYVIAKRLYAEGKQLSPKLMREILWFAPLHDIGKIGIPDSVLLKPGKLNDEEWRIMQSHVMTGEAVIEAMNRGLGSTVREDMLQTALEIVGTHHERWDGAGYPRGLAGTQIPLAGRIVAVADVFDALSSARPYKPALSVSRSLEIMRSERGEQFDPEVLDAFLKVLPEIERIRAENTQKQPADERR